MTSGTGRSNGRSCACGFTLIELLIVLVILGVLSTYVALTTTPDTRREAANDATRLQLVLEIALQEAQVSGRPIAWVAEGTRYRFVQGNFERRWQAITDDEYLRPRELTQGVRIGAITVDGQPLPQDSWLVFASSTAPLFQIQLDSPQGFYVLRSRPNGRVDLLAPASS